METGFILVLLLRRTCFLGALQTSEDFDKLFNILLATYSSKLEKPSLIAFFPHRIFYPLGYL